MYYLYVIKSLKDKGIYIGITDNIEKRLDEHNKGKTKSTKSRIPFILVYYEAYKNKADCRRRELALKKSGQQREVLKERIKNSLSD